MADDIVTRLRSEPGPSECWHCGEWGCCNKDGQSLYSCEHDAVDCGCDNDCSCSCHTWWTHVREAADEIERLRAVLNAIDATHQSFTDPDTGMTFCDECNTIDLWPCRTHIFLYPDEARRG